MGAAAKSYMNKYTVSKWSNLLRTHFVRFLPVLFLVFVWLFFTVPYAVKQKVPFPSQFLVTFFPPWSPYYGMPVKNNAMPDIITQIYPWRMHAISSWKRGVVPMWNPYSFSGTVHAANYQSDVFSPQNLFFLLFDPILAWSIIVLIQPLLASFCMYYFLKVHDRSDVAAVLGSIAFMFCGFMTVWMGYATLGYAVLVTPLLLAAVKRYFENQSWWQGLVITFAMLFSFISGHFQMSVYVLLFTLGYAFYLSLFEKKFFKLGGVLLFLLTGVTISLPQLVIAFNAFLSSNRADSYITSAGIPWQYLITVLAPDVFGNPVTRNDWFGQYAEWASYIGVIPFLFAVYGIIRLRTKKTYYFLIAGVIALLLATVSPFSILFYRLHIPMLSTSVATRLIVFVSFILAYFAACGFDIYREDIKNNSLKLLVKITAALIIVLIGGVILIFLWPQLPVVAKQIAPRNSILPIFLLLIPMGFAFFAIRKPKWQWIFMLLILAVVSFDGLRYVTKWMPFDPPQFVYPKLPIINYLVSLGGIDRVWGNTGNELNTYFHIPSIEGYDAMYQARYGEFISSAADGSIKPIERSVVKIDRQGKYTKRWFDLLGVRYILYRISDGRNVWAFPHWQYPDIVSRYKDDYYEVLENTSALPRAFLVSAYAVETDRQKIINYLTDPAFDAKDTVVLEKRPAFAPQAGNGKLNITLYSPERVMMRVDTEVPKLLFLSDVYDKGWKALIDGERTDILRADYAFRAVAVPQGLHTIEFYYAPDSMGRAVDLAAVAFIILLIGSIKKLRYEHWNF